MGNRPWKEGVGEGGKVWLGWRSEVGDGEGSDYIFDLLRFVNCYVKLKVLTLIIS